MDLPMRLVCPTILSLLLTCALPALSMAQDTPLEPDDTLPDGTTPKVEKTKQTDQAKPTPPKETKKTTAEATPAKAPKATSVPPKQDVSVPVFRSFAFNSELKPNSKIPRDKWRLTFGGYIRLQYSGIQNDDNAPLIGRNDGFLLANARPTFTGEMGNGLGFRLQFETAANLDQPNTLTPAQEMIVRPRDTFIFYRPFSFLTLQMGQFKPPHDLEALLSTADLAFVIRSVGAQGVPRFADVRPQIGLSVDRQVGLQAIGQYFFTSEDNSPKGPGIGYALAVTNGTSSNQTVNDNDSLAYYGRLSFHWGDMLSIGGAYYVNDLLNGTPPDLIVINRSGWTADLLLRAFGVHLMASVTGQTDETDLFTASNPAGEPTTFNTSLAYQAQLGYRIPVINVMPAVRYAFYDPTNTFNQVDVDDPGLDAREVDALTYITFGLSYIPNTYPITVMLNYTLAGEQEGAESLNNDRFDAMVQLTW